MIKYLSPQGKYMYVHGGNASNYINNFPGAQGVGNMRFNTTNQNMEVWDGNGWQTLGMNTATIGLNPEAESLLDWARDKRNEELAYKSLAEKNQAVKIALDNVEEAKRQLSITAKLAREHETTTS